MQFNSHSVYSTIYNRNTLSCRGIQQSQCLQHYLQQEHFVLSWNSTVTVFTALFTTGTLCLVVEFNSHSVYSTICNRNTLSCRGIQQSQCLQHYLQQEHFVLWNSTVTEITALFTTGTLCLVVEFNSHSVYSIIYNRNTLSCRGIQQSQSLQHYLQQEHFVLSWNSTVTVFTALFTTGTLCLVVEFNSHSVYSTICNRNTLSCRGIQQSQCLQHYLQQEHFVLWNSTVTEFTALFTTGTLCLVVEFNSHSVYSIIYNRNTLSCRGIQQSQSLQHYLQQEHFVLSWNSTVTVFTALFTTGTLCLVEFNSHRVYSTIYNRNTLSCRGIQQSQCLQHYLQQEHFVLSRRQPHLSHLLNPSPNRYARTQQCQTHHCSCVREHQYCQTYHCPACVRQHQHCQTYHCPACVRQHQQCQTYYCPACVRQHQRCQTYHCPACVRQHQQCQTYYCPACVRQHQHCQTYHCPACVRQHQQCQTYYCPACVRQHQRCQTYHCPACIRQHQQCQTYHCPACVKQHQQCQTSHALCVRQHQQCQTYHCPCVRQHQQCQTYHCPCAKQHQQCQTYHCPCQTTPTMSDRSMLDISHSVCQTTPSMSDISHSCVRQHQQSQTCRCLASLVLSITLHVSDNTKLARHRQRLLTVGQDCNASLLRACRKLGGNSTLAHNLSRQDESGYLHRTAIARLNRFQTFSNFGWKLWASS